MKQPLWSDNKTFEDILDIPNKDDVILNLHEDICCLKESHDRVLALLDQIANDGSSDIGVITMANMATDILNGDLD